MIAVEMLLLLLIFCLALPVTFGWCYEEGGTCREGDFNEIKDVKTLYECQQICLENGFCSYFTWYNQQSSWPEHYTCVLFNQPTEDRSCSNCISGYWGCSKPEQEDGNSKNIKGPGVVNAAGAIKGTYKVPDRVGGLGAGDDMKKDTGAK